MAEIIYSLFIFALTFCWTGSVEDKYYPRYHLAPPGGWMNDPNGFCVFKDEYHLFYQYNPESSMEPGIAHWGHAKSKDLFNWEHLPIAMYPDQSYDDRGVFSGSAIVEDDVMYLFYTGNIKNPDAQRQALAYSKDGVNVEKYEGNPIIMSEEHQPNIRDPKVWKHEDKYYMVLGNSFNNNTLGRILLYSSEDKISWKQVSILGESTGFLGYMWECPDFFELNGKWVLLFSPQGVKPQGDKYKNLYQTGYIIGDFSYDTCEFSPLTEFKELDFGHDFYATQTIEDNKGRRILVAWQDMWETNYPEQTVGFTGQMTMPRVLEVTDDYTLVQKPVEEMEGIKSNVLLSGKITKDTSVALEDNAGEIKIVGKKDEDIEVVLKSGDESVRISYDAKEGKVTLDRGGNDGVRRTDWKPKDDFTWRLFVDGSSIEMFCGKGEVVFSSRFFPKEQVMVEFGGKARENSVTVTSIKRSVPKPGKEKYNFGDITKKVFTYIRNIF